ncbi:hypothetical protein [Halovulum marinum]|nr:hypothetical protein [Halovulum marinum]
MRRLIRLLCTSPVEGIALLLLAGVLVAGVLDATEARELPPLGRVGAR